MSKLKKITANFQPPFTENPYFQVNILAGIYLDHQNAKPT